MRSLFSLKPRFSLRILLLVLTASGLVAFWISRAERQRQAVAALRSLNEYECVFYSFDYEGPCARVVGRRFEPGAWAETVGIDFFYRATNVFVDVDDLDAALPLLKRLPSLSEVYVRADNGNGSEADSEVASTRVKSAVQRLRRELPGVQSDAYPGCLLHVNKIPVVG